MWERVRRSTAKEQREQERVGSYANTVCTTYGMGGDRVKYGRGPEENFVHVGGERRQHVRGEMIDESVSMNERAARESG